MSTVFATRIMGIRHYMQAVEEGNARVQEEYLTQTEMMEEEMFLGLRKKTGVSKKRFEEKFGVNFDQQLWISG